MSVGPVGETPTKVDVRATVRNYLADGLEYGTRYGIRVAAINANGQGPWNGGHFVWTGSQQKQVPIYGELRVSFSSINVGSGIIAEGYNVTPPDLQVDITATSPLQGSRCPSSGADEPTWTRSPEPPADITRRFWGCSAGTSTVRLISDQTVLASTTVTVKGSTQPQPQPTATPKPTVSGLTATATMTSVTLSWREQSGTQYEVSKLNDMGDYVVVASIFGSSYMDPGPLECRTEYTYRVHARKNNQWGSYVTKRVSTTACACESINLVSSVDANNILAVPSTGQRPRFTFERESGRYPELDCQTRFRPSPNYAVLYRFRTEEKLHLRLWVRSSFPTDPTIALVNNATNSIIEFNDISNEHGNDQNAQIAQVFGAGDYTIEVAAAWALDAGKSYSLVVFAYEAMPAHGHQRDHTVQYALGEMPDSGIEATLFPNVINKAAERWNSAATVQTPKIRFCKKPRPTVDPLEDPPDPAECPTGANDDGNTVVVSVETDTTTCDDPTRGTHHVACADVSASGGHMTSTAIYFEHPTTTLWDKDGVTTEYKVKWHNVPRSDRVKITIGSETYIGVYLRGVAMHEFGHAAGLADLDDEDYPGFVMASEPEIQNVPPRDIIYLDQVYRNEHGAGPHDSQGNPLD